MTDTATLARLYHSLYRIRRTEEEIARIYPSDKIKSPVHLSIGQEAVSVGVCDALRPEDVVFGTYRGHATYLAKGGDLKRMMAELYGKDAGCTRGKGGSMHLIDVAHGVMGTSAVVATTIPHAVGYAYALKFQRRDLVAVSFFGDGAVEEGAYHESLNFAALKQLPVLFVCENNSYAIHSRLLARRRHDNICDQARAYGIPAERIPASDVVAVRAKAAEALAQVRAGSGPRFLECLTYRWKEHVGPGDDWALGYRTPDEGRPWIEGDAVAAAGRALEAGRRKEIEADVEREIREAIQFAERSPFPAGEELHTDVLAE
jgi:TPP-dependent pyruvate/acetoin dehydrogenase alpha subunit